MTKVYAVCRCFYQRNLFVKTWKKHCTFVSETQFKEDYDHNVSKEELDHVVSELKIEIDRRKTIHQQLANARRNVIEKYTPLHPNIFSLHDDFLSGDFRSLVRSAKNNVIHGDIQELKNRIFTFPVFTEDFCNTLIAELHHFKSSNIEHPRPVSMHQDAINLSVLGFDKFFTDFRTQYLQPICNIIFPEFNGAELDSHKAFVIMYNLQGETELDEHFDNAEITLNVSLTDSHEGGELVFRGMVDGPQLPPFGVEHVKARGIFHRGEQFHQALPITEGERYNLIIWFRMSSVRNQQCPMCGEIPDLEPVNVESSYGDGFTIQEENVCSMT